MIVGYSRTFGPAATITNTAFASDDTTQTTYTFASQAIGTAASTRVVIVCGGTRNSAQMISSMTIGGISATKAISAAGASSFNSAEIWYAVVPTGTTATISLTLGSSAPRYAISVYAANGLLNAGAPTATGSSTAATPSVSISPPGFGVGVAFVFGGQNGTTAWTGFTEDVDQTVASQNYSSASATASSATSPPVTCAGTPSYNDPIMVVATFR